MGASRAPHPFSSRATSSRNAGRDHLGMVGGIIPESWAASPGIRSLLRQIQEIQAELRGSCFTRREHKQAQAELKKLIK